MAIFEVYDKAGKKRKVEADDIESAFEIADSVPAQRTWTQSARGLTGQFLQGMPVIGNYAQPAAAKLRSTLGLGKQGEDYDKQLESIKTADTSFQKNNPAASMGARIAGGATAMLPLMPIAGEIAGPGILANMATQGALGAATGTADRFAKEHAQGTLSENFGKPEFNRSVTENATKDALLSSLGPLIGKLISPGTVHAPNSDYAKTAAQVGKDYDYLKLLKHPDKTLEDLAQSAVLRRLPQTTISPPSERTQMALSALGGLGLSHFAGTDPLLSALAGPAAREVAKYAFKSAGIHPEKYFNNQIMLKHPGVQNILDVLGQGTGLEANRR